MTDNNTTTPPTDADQPDAQAGDPQPANADENRPPAGEASDADTAPDTDADDGKHQALNIAAARVGHHGQDFRWLPVRRDDCRGFAVAFDDQLVEVAGLGGLQSMKREVVEDEEVDTVRISSS